MTYGVMQDRIAAELGRSDLTTGIQQAIQTAVKHYERSRFHFNEARGSFSVSSGQEYYTSVDFADIPNLLTIDSLTIDVNSSTYPLMPRDYAYIDEIQTNAGYTGDPTDYVYYAQQIRLYPIPSAGRTVNISYVKRLTTLSATTDTNAWVTDAEDLIRAKAKKELYRHRIYDANKAKTMSFAESYALASLNGELMQRITGRLRPTAF